MTSESENIKKLPPEDIVKFLKENNSGVIIKYMNWWGPLRSRVWAFAAMLDRRFSFGEFCQLLLPLSFTGKLKLMDRYEAFLLEELRKECPSFSGNCVKLFGNMFGGPNYGEVIEVINQVIVSDQYHADQFIKKDSIVVDAGGHIGTFSVLTASLAPQGQVYSFEPVVRTFNTLKKIPGIILKLSA